MGDRVERVVDGELREHRTTSHGEGRSPAESCRRPEGRAGATATPPGAQSEVEALRAEVARLKAELDASIREREAVAADLMAALSDARQTVIALGAELRAVRGSTSWRITRPLRQLLGPRPRLAATLRRLSKLVWWTVTLQLPGRLRTALAARGASGLMAQLTQSGVCGDAEAARNREGQYPLWIGRFDFDPRRDGGRLRRAVEQLPHKPLISVLMPVYDPPERYLEEAIQSVRRQIYPHWELCIADDASPGPHVRRILDRWAAQDSRIKVVHRPVNGHISEATNSAFELATGELVALLDHDDVLREHALAEIALCVNARPDAQLIYSDEDKIDGEGRRSEPYFKPDWSPDLFRAQNYLNHLTVHRAQNIRRAGGWRKGFEGSQDYDLGLRIVETLDPRAIVHVPKILYHWRAAEGSTARAIGEKSYAVEAGRRALAEHIERLGLPARAEDVPGVPYYRTVHALPTPEPLVSLVVPTRDKADLLRMCLGSVLKRTRYPSFEILVVDNGSREPETARYFDELSHHANVRVLEFDRPFNYSQLNNFAVRQAKGSIVGLLNNDIEVISPDWLTEMVGHACRPEIGCVGAKLYYPNETIQHAGIVLGIGGVAGHSHKYFARASTGYFGRLRLCHNVSAVTGACLIVRKEVYEQVGGLDEQKLAIAFNDVDFCLKVRAAGYANLWTPFAELYHHESVSRGAEDNSAKVARFHYETTVMQERWGEALLNDPFYSPHLTLEREDFGIRTADAGTGWASRSADRRRHVGP